MSLPFESLRALSLSKRSNRRPIYVGSGLTLARLLLLAALLVGSGCTVLEWKSTYGLHHPLTGKIWDVSAASFIDRTTFVSRLAQARFVLLGENHDNPDHHRLQAELLRQLIDAGRRPAVGFEMLDIDDAPAIAKHLATAPKDAAGLGEVVGWNRRGWPDWKFYQPIAQVALEAGLPIVAMNLRRATVETLRRDGVAGLDRGVVSQLDLDRPVPPGIWRKMADDIRKSHCGYAPEDRLETMIIIQRARDARMADGMIASGRHDGMVLVVGAGHTRIDYGIPTHLRSRARGQTLVSLAFWEVQEDKTVPGAYASEFARDMLPFDYVWFTPRRANQDPCEEFKHQLQRLKKKK